MRLKYDEDFVEGAVFVRAASRSLPRVASLQMRRFHYEREQLYAIADPDERNTAFFKLHLEWFREWGLEHALLEPAAQFPLFDSHLSALVFRNARIRRDEGVELYVSAEQGRSAVAALRAERFDDINQLGGFLRHEFMHVNDMLNPAFAYSPHLNLPGQNAVQQRLTRERYRLLWDITIDGRLAGSASDGPLRDRHRATFDRAFDFWPEYKRCSVFEALWTNDHPCHEALLAIASDPRGLNSLPKASPGAPCPLCGFGTFDWSDTGRLDESTIGAIQKEFEAWIPSHGACRRCIEIYSKRLAFACLP